MPACSPDYLIKRGGRNPTLTKVDEVPQSWDSPLDAFRHVYGHECEVSEMIDRLMQTAIEEKDNATQEFLWHFVREQVEEEATGRIYRREDSDGRGRRRSFSRCKTG